MSASPRRIVAEPLTAEDFAPFGEVLALPQQPARVDFSAGLKNLRPDASACLRSDLIAPSALPLTVRLMERHPHSSQAFLPLDVSRYLVLVAPSRPDDRPDTAGMRAFICGAGQGINYRPGTWHHPMTALDRPGLFATVMWLDGGNGDEEFVDLAEPLVVSAGDALAS